MLWFIFILIMLGAGVTGWMGYKHTSYSKSVEKNLATRRTHYSRLRLARETDRERAEKSDIRENADISDGR